MQARFVRTIPVGIAKTFWFLNSTAMSTHHCSALPASLMEDVCRSSPASELRWLLQPLLDLSRSTLASNISNIYRPKSSEGRELWWTSTNHKWTMCKRRTTVTHVSTLHYDERRLDCRRRVSKPGISAISRHLIKLAMTSSQNSTACFIPPLARRHRSAGESLGARLT